MSIGGKQMYLKFGTILLSSFLVNGHIWIFLKLWEELWNPSFQKQILLEMMMESGGGESAL